VVDYFSLFVAAVCLIKRSISKSFSGHSVIVLIKKNLWCDLLIHRTVSGNVLDDDKYNFICSFTALLLVDAQNDQ